MRKSLGVVAGAVLAMMSSSTVFAADDATDLKVGKKVYDRFMGRGCGTCHDIKTNPQLIELIKAGSLSEDKFLEVLKNGKNGMPKAGPGIMAIKYVTKSGYSEEEAMKATYKYLAKQAGK